MINTQVHKFIKESRFLVTGGAGFIGSNLVEVLLEYGAAKVVVLDDLSTGCESNIVEFENNNNNFEFIEGSIVDYEQCMAVMDGVDVVFHLAALGSVPRSIDNPIATNEVNVNGFLNVLNAAKENKINKLVYSSSSSIYGDDDTLPKLEENTGNPLSPYAVSKRTNELYARTFSDLYEMDIIGLRYFNVFGPKQNIKGPYAAVIPIFIDNLLNNKICYINGDGTISRDFTYVKNVVEANILSAFTKIKGPENRLFNIAMGNQTSLNDLYQELEKIIQTGLKAEYRQKRAGDIDSSLAAIAKAIKYIGYKPKYAFKEGIEKTIEWYRRKP